jgi:hypothetical protein
MNVYKKAEGKWVGTQALAGNKDVIEIPTTSKPQFLEWLNENLSNISGDTIPSPAPTAVSSDSKCPKCKLTPKVAENVASHMRVDAIVDRILEAESAEANRLMEATINRCMELKNALS